VSWTLGQGVGGVVDSTAPTALAATSGAAIPAAGSGGGAG
jgi:hypothetical protein